MTAPRVLFVSHSGVLGGAERSLLDLAGAWPSARQVIALSEGPFVEALAARGIPARVEPLRALGEVRRDSALPKVDALADVARLAVGIANDARRMDVIHANSQKAFVVAAAAGLLARRPVVWHLRDILTTAHFSASNIRAAVLLANARAVAVIANSEATAVAFREAGGRADRVQVVHNGIDAAPFDAVTAAQVRGARNELGAGDAFVIAACARLAPWKGQHVVIAAMEALPTMQCWVIGAALFGEEQYGASLRSQAASLGVAERVRFLGDRTDVPVLLRAADVVVHSAVDAEPFGRVVVEGMLARRPVIASDAGGVREILRHGETGWLVRPGDPVALAEAVKVVRALSEEQRRAVTERAHVDALARFSVEAMVAGVRRVLEGVIRRRRGAARPR